MTTLSTDLFRRTNEIREQENPHQHQTNYDLMKLLETEGYNIDLTTTKKLVMALDVLPGYFPEQKLDFENKKHLEKFQLLLGIQEKDKSYLRNYDLLEIKDAKNRLENSQKSECENFKKLVRESSLISDIPIAGPFLKDLLINPITKPCQQASIGLKDLSKTGCIGKIGFVSIENLLAVSSSKLDLKAENLQSQSYAYYITELHSKTSNLNINFGSLQQDIHGIKIDIDTYEKQICELDASLQNLGKDLSGLHNIDSYGKRIDQLEKKQKELDAKEKAEKFKLAVTRSFVALSKSLTHFNNYLDQAARDKAVNKAEIQQFLNTAKFNEKLLEQSNKPINDFINTERLFQKTAQGKDSLNRLKSLIEDIDGLIEERKELAKKGNIQVININGVSQKIQNSYVAIKKEQEELAKHSGYIGLASNVIGDALSEFPPTMPVGVAIKAVGQVFCLIDRHSGRDLRKQENHYSKLSGKYHNIGGKLGDVVSDNYGNIHSLQIQSDHLGDIYISELSQHPEDHDNLLKELQEKELKKRNKLADLDKNILTQERIFADKKNAVENAKKSQVKYSLQKISLEELEQKDPDLVAKHANNKGAIESIKWDSVRNLVVIHKNGKYRVYKIGKGEASALFESKKRSDVDAQYSFSFEKIKPKDQEKAKANLDKAEVELLEHKNILTGYNQQKVLLTGEIKVVENDIKNAEENYQEYIKETEAQEIAEKMGR